MRRRTKVPKKPRNGSRDRGAETFHSPFAELGRELRRQRRRHRAEASSPTRPPRPAPPQPASEDTPADETRRFEEAMRGVTPLDAHGRPRSHASSSPLRPAPRPDEEHEAVEELNALLTARRRFDVRDGGEGFHGAVAGLQPTILDRLRRGGFSWQAHIDLHGLRSDEAREAVAEFLRDAETLGHRCVLIVHGRGFGSKDETPVLRERLKAWLSRGRLSRTVLAFCSARPCDGGSGAIYVLVARPAKRGRLAVTEGAAFSA